MKASYRWLVELSGGTLPAPEEVARLLTSGGLEIANVPDMKEIEDAVGKGVRQA